MKRSCTRFRSRVKLPRPELPIWLGPAAYRALAAIAVALAIGAALPPFVWIAAAASIVLAVLIAADLLYGPRLHAITIERVTPEPFVLRRAGTLQYRVENRNRTAVRLCLTEHPLALLQPEVNEIIATAGPGSASLVQSRVMPVARGTGVLEALYVWVEHPQGLLRRRKRFAMPAEVRVYPDLSAIERYGSLHARNRLIDAGLRRMRLRESGTEMESVREWCAGDSFRHVNWKATARRGRMMVSQYEAERSQNIVMLLDAGRLMTPRVGDRSKFDFAVAAALCVASVASLANDKVGFVAFAGEILRAVAPRMGGRRVGRLVAELHDVQPRFEESDYVQAIAYVRTHVKKRSLLVLFTDMLDPAAQSSVLAEIGSLASRHVVLCVFMNDAAVTRALDRIPERVSDVYEMAVALELRDERRKAVAELERLGIHVLDVPAAQLTTALVDRYLSIKQRGAI